MNGLGQAAGWLTPLLLLPGVGMLILSTSVRYGQLHDELHRLLTPDSDVGELVTRRFQRRSRLFRDAFVCLYASVVSLTGSALLGGALALSEAAEQELALGVTAIGIGLVVAAAALLCREAFMANDAIRDVHLDHGA